MDKEDFNSKIYLFLAWRSIVKEIAGGSYIWKFDRILTKIPGVVAIPAESSP